MRLPATLSAVRSRVWDSFKRRSFFQRGGRRARRSKFVAAFVFVLTFITIYSIRTFSFSGTAFKNTTAPWETFYDDADVSFNNLQWIPISDAQNRTDLTSSYFHHNISTYRFSTFSQWLNLTSATYPKQPERKANACVFYDAPPRTGAEVIAPALRECLGGQGFQFLGADVEAILKSGKRHDTQFRFSKSLTSLDALLTSGDSNLSPSETTTDRYVALASVSLPLIFSPQALDSVRAVCESVLYVTSARSMVHRLTDALWSDAQAERSENDPLALSVAAAADVDALARVERVYTAFPWLTRVDSLHSRMETEQLLQQERLHDNLSDSAGLLGRLGSSLESVPEPDYVITEGNFSSHLRLLLEAFGCNAPAVNEPSWPFLSEASSWLFSYRKKSLVTAKSAETPLKMTSNITAPFYTPRRLSGRDVVIDRLGKVMKSNDASFEKLFAISQCVNDHHGLRIARHIRNSIHLKF